MQFHLLEVVVRMEATRVLVVRVREKAHGHVAKLERVGVVCDGVGADCEQSDVPLLELLRAFADRVQLLDAVDALVAEIEDKQDVLAAILLE